GLFVELTGPTVVGPVTPIIIGPVGPTIVEPTGPTGPVVAMGSEDSNCCSVTARTGARAACGARGVAGGACIACGGPSASQHVCERRVVFVEFSPKQSRIAQQREVVRVCNLVGVLCSISSSNGVNCTLFQGVAADF